MFWNLFSSSISLATVTPSLVTVGAPHDFSITTLRPRGPRVTRTALASVFRPLAISPRAFVEKIRSLAAIVPVLLDLVRIRRGQRQRRFGSGRGRGSRALSRAPRGGRPR